MNDLVKQMCAMCIFFGAMLSLTPEGGAKKMMELGCAAALTLMLVLPIKSMDFEAYALELAKYKEQEALLIESEVEQQRRLNRLVIENDYETYILDKAQELGMAVTSVEVVSQWSAEGLWLPYTVAIEGDYTVEQKKRLVGIIKTELGVPDERQRWSGDGY